MEIIRSADNKTVKHINKLKIKKYRDKYDEFIAEGYKNVLDTCKAKPKLVKYVVFGETAYAKYGAEFGELPAVVVDDKLFAKLAETQSSQGVLSVHKKPNAVFPKSEACILLDRVRDPGNVGTVLRTAVACGYDVVLNNCADAYSPKVVRSAMSAVVKCNIGIDIEPSALKKAGYSIIVADMYGKNVFEAAHVDKYCIVIGNEADGVSHDIADIADASLCVPQSGIESLNAAVAAAVMMFALKYAAR